MKIIQITFLFLFTQINAQIINEGIFSIGENSVFSSPVEFTNKSSATMTNKGVVHWQSNFINNGNLPESANANTATGITHFDSATNTIQTISGSNKVVFENMVVNMTNVNAKGVSVADELELIIEKSLTLTNGDLRLIGEAQLIQKHTNVNQNSGNANLLRDQQGTISTYNYNYWSSPVSGNSVGSFTLDDVLFDGSDATINPFSPTKIDFITGNSSNGNPTTTDINDNVTDALDINRRWLYKFENGNIGDGSDWASVAFNESINIGIGYTMKGPGGITPSQNYVFKGKPNDGTYNFILGANKSTLLGNPYPCALDANKFINDNLANFNGTIYYWEHWGGNSHTAADFQGGYATYTLAGGTPAVSHPDVNPGGTSSGINGSRYIPVGQGFFIESVVGGTVTIDNSQRIFKLENTTDSYFRTPDNTIVNTNNDNADSVQRIRLAFNNTEGYYRQIMTAFLPETTENIDNGYDGKMADVNESEMYWLLNNEPYVINALPFNDNLQMPIGINVAVKGKHSIYLDEVENFNNDIYILDTETNTTHNIIDSNFEINLPVGIYLNRFYLVFQPQSPLNTNELITESIHVFYANTHHNLVIQNPNSLQIRNVTIYNAIGQVIKKTKTQTNFTKPEFNINLNIAFGTYFIHVETNLGTSAFKILVY